MIRRGIIAANALLLATQFEARTAEALVAEARQAKVRALQQRDLAVHAIAALVGRGGGT